MSGWSRKRGGREAAAGEHRRDGAGRPFVHRRRVPKPGRVLGQAREARIAHGVELAVRPQEGDGRQLVEDDHDDGRPRGRLEPGAVRRALEQAGHRREGEEEDEDEERRGPDDGQHHPHRARPRVEKRAETAERRGEGDRADADPAERLEGKEREQRGEEGEVEDRRRLLADEAGQGLEAEQEERRQDDDAHREEDDVPARRAAHGEELDVARE